MNDEKEIKNFHIAIESSLFKWIINSASNCFMTTEKKKKEKVEDEVEKKERQKTSKNERKEK